MPHSEVAKGPPHSTCPLAQDVTATGGCQWENLIWGSQWGSMLVPKHGPLHTQAGVDLGFHMVWDVFLNCRLGWGVYVCVCEGVGSRGGWGARSKWVPWFQCGAVCLWWHILSVSICLEVAEIVGVFWSWSVLVFGSPWSSSLLCLSIPSRPHTHLTLLFLSLLLLALKLGALWPWCWPWPPPNPFDSVCGLWFLSGWFSDLLVYLACTLALLWRKSRFSVIFDLHFYF